MVINVTVVPPILIKKSHLDSISSEEITDKITDSKITKNPRTDTIHTLDGYF